MRIFDEEILVRKLTTFILYIIIYIIILYYISFKYFVKPFLPLK